MLALHVVALLVSVVLSSYGLALPARQINPIQHVLLSAPKTSTDLLLCGLSLAPEGHGSPTKPGDGDDKKTIYQVIREDEAFSKLAEIIEERKEIAKGLDSPDADVTLFAPVNSAFKHVPGCPDDKKPPEEVVTKVLLYHIVDKAHKTEDLENGQLLDTRLKLESLGDRPQKIRVFEHKNHIALNLRSHIVAADIKASNGVIQGVDHIIVPPPNVFYVLGHFPLEFGIFEVAIGKAGLKDVVKETAAITVFAPSNRAFKKLGFKRLRYLFSPDGVEDLRRIVSYHISPQLVYTPDIWKAKELELPTIEGAKLKITAKEKDDKHDHKHPVIEINEEAHVFINDGIAMNGVIHAIDAVLSPVQEVPKQYYASGSYTSERNDMEKILQMIIDMDI
ncbi:uncharacterized protein SPPG_01316 [Spizellomyces punctatus DAOM BR117]|uniref:FAS1 domain-containing protein n=1 Tax=Spizellomyces punctatus (strain DAOM BR117) TaxID=645134 RepID=A0A0L0HRV9_SPIPD|nr:uncharacterized protein SPPG_01316 [Spizellomyces punctatus DAOM BR117]KND03863.1 hypothetical protein SPPG_01316 [Spizellomyces punctatus DAOM BR117]|eukprot:XP_016611902.1 hypothetical protein SPPG_01316 [Spizellomyces punctatus DAOM BR117]